MAGPVSEVAWTSCFDGVDPRTTASVKPEGEDGSNMDIVWQWLWEVEAKRHAGQGLVEYALILVLISVVSIAIMTTLGQGVSSVFSQANAAL